jgi:sodium/bile acid cotransporter 7
MPSFLKLRIFLKNNLDVFTLGLVAAVILAVFLPARGQGYKIFSFFSKLVVASLFFLHGVKLSRKNLWEGLTNWPLHLVITISTFVLFPVFGYALKPILGSLVGPELYMGLLFLCALPSTVQSSIAFTSIAKGNVAAAVCAASASSLLGVFLTPLLCGLMFRADGAFGLSAGQAILDLSKQLILPFALGQILHGPLSGWMARHKKLIGLTDRLSVLFIVYVSFSQATNTGLWSSLSAEMLPGLLGSCAVILALALLATWLMGKGFGFSREDRVAILFCGSKKSLITGVPMANVIFSPAVAGLIVLPLMAFHQMQLIVCAWLSRRMGLKLGEDSQR